ncbi:MAG: DUF6279 family lipoprotein [Gammaproteobacteria bacterium]|nr:DUF6279 family lipoprotein [Gammaproteobacteria bacterium]MDH5801007.1 DUF6279 family lipoprotein [Gammaproteobacteria bacterium]
MLNIYSFIINWLKNVLNLQRSQCVSTPLPVTSNSVKGFVVSMALVLALTACSTQTSYKYLDWIIPWYLSDLVTLDQDQSDLLNAYIQTNLSWHKQTQIPRYIDTLTQIREELDNLDGRRIQQIIDAYEQYWTHIVAKTTPHITRLLQSASEEQLQELFSNLVQQNNSLREQYVLPSVRQQARLRSHQFADQARYWVGELTASQQRAIEKWSLRLRPANQLWIQHRLHWQENFRVALSARDDPEYFGSIMQELLISPDRYWTEKYATVQRINEQQTIQLILYLVRDLTESQRDFLVQRIDEILAQLKEIYYS